MRLNLTQLTEAMAWFTNRTTNFYRELRRPGSINHKENEHVPYFFSVDWVLVACYCFCWFLSTCQRVAVVDAVVACRHWLQFWWLADRWTDLLPALRDRVPVRPAAPPAIPNAIRCGAIPDGFHFLAVSRPRGTSPKMTNWNQTPRRTKSNSRTSSRGARRLPAEGQDRYGSNVSSTNSVELPVR